MSTDSITATSGAAKNLESARRFVFTKQDTKKAEDVVQKNALTSKEFNLADVMPSDIQGYLSEVVSTINQSLASNPVVEPEDARLNNVRTSSLSADYQHSFVPKSLPTPGTPPSQNTIRLMAGDEISALVVLISQKMVKSYTEYSGLINQMPDIQLKYAMSMWSIFTNKAQSMAAEQRKEAVDADNKMRDLAAAAGKCAMSSNIGQAVGTAIAAGVIIALSGGTATALSAVILATTLLTSAISIVNSGMKADAGFKLWRGASSENQISDLIASCMKDINFGFFAKTDDPAKNEMIYNVITTAITMCFSAGELAAAKGVAAGAEAGAKASEKAVADAATSSMSASMKEVSMTAFKLSKMPSYLNTAVTLAGMGMSVSDSTGKKFTHDDHEHDINICAAMSAGFAGLAEFMIMETDWGTGKTASERIKQDQGDYAAMGVESGMLLIGSLGWMALEMRLRNTLSGESLMSKSTLALMSRIGVAQMILQSAQVCGQSAQSVITALEAAQQDTANALIQSYASELQMFKAGMDSLMARNSEDTRTFVDSVVTNTAKNYGYFLNEINKIFSNMGKLNNRIFT